MLAQSDLKDLAMHTELCSDAYLALYKAGKLTNKYKNIDRGKGVFGCDIGSNELYEWLDDNPGIAAYPLEYVNKRARGLYGGLHGDPVVPRLVHEELRLRLYGAVEHLDVVVFKLHGGYLPPAGLLGRSLGDAGKALQRGS